MDDENSVQIAFDADVSDAEKKVKQLEDAVDKALKEGGGDAAINKELDEALDTISKIEKALGGVRTQPITNAKWTGYDKEALKSIDEQYGELGESAEAGTQKVNSLKAAIDSVKDELKKQEGEGKWFGDVKYDEAYRTLVELNAAAAQRVAELSKTPAQMEREAAAAQRVAEHEAAIAQKAEERAAKEAAAVAEEERLAAMKAEAEIADAEIVQLNAQLLLLKQQQIDLERAGVTAGYEEYDRITAEIARITQQVAAYQKKLKTTSSQTKEVAENTKGISPAMKAANKSLDKFTRRIVNLVKRVFVFSMITTALRGMRTWLGNVVEANDEAATAIGNLKGALLTLVQPLVNVVIPALVSFVNILTSAVNKLSSIVSKIFGATQEASAAAAEALYNETEALNSTTSAAKKAQKTLAGFDEINKLDSADDSGSSSSSSGITPNFNATATVSEAERLAELFVGAALFAVGAILTFTGNLAIGITLMVIGALAIYDVYSEDPEAFKDYLTFTTAEKLFGGILLVLVGVILMFTGVAFLLGLALVVLGGYAIWTAASENPDEVKSLLSSKTATIAEILIGVVLVIVGLVLAFTGVGLALGIALMALGAVALATAAYLNWDTIKNKLQDPIWRVVALIVGVVLCVVGLILAFTGVATALGIALIAAGAVTLATTVALNWSWVKDKLSGPLATIVGIVCAAMLVLGIILLFTGAAAPLGVALLAAGAATLVAAKALNWTSIINTVKSVLQTVASVVSGVLLVLGVVLAFSGVGLPLGLALIAAGAAGLTATGVINWNAIAEKIKGVWNTIKSWWDTYVAKYFTAEYWQTLAKNMMNGFISKIESGLNSALSGAGSFVNKIIGVLNNIPGISLSTVSWGKVSLPRLAQGAVIPPNREFMAVLGDQKHGTNIEAPLETIQEAVALVMSDFIDSNMAGHEATVAVLREILSAVLGISIGDDMIADAVSRANTRRSIMRGSV